MKAKGWIQEHRRSILFLLALLFLTGGMSGAFVWIGLFWGFAVALRGIYVYFG